MDDTEQSLPAWPGLVASAISTCVSRAATYPADTLKARLQVQGALAKHLRYKNTVQACREVIRSEGVGGFYRGFLPVLAGVLPATVLYFYSYETAKKLIAGRHGALGDFTVGAVAQLSAGLIFTPVDIVKERLQVQKMMGSKQNTALEAFSSLLTREGPKGLLRGYWLTNSVWIPWTSMYIALYESMKRTLARRLHRAETEELPSWAFAACSGGAAAAAALATHPLDVIKTRLQVLSADPNYANITAIKIAKDMINKEGWRALTHGMLARMLQITPGAAISWLMYELIKSKLAQATTEQKLETSTAPIK